MIPATTLLTRTDLRDRFARGRVRNLIATAGDAEKFEGLDPGLTRIAVGDAPAGWHRYDDLMSFPSAFLPNGETRASDPLLLYFTSGNTAKPKLVLHSLRAIRSGNSPHSMCSGCYPAMCI